ncbi:MAG: type II toxin-antitoxin system VapC family toxin [Chloroflexota bacterium]|nr:type II toxin-antitoxin system VapC family toxin [Chloroflexota bacterium]
MRLLLDTVVFIWLVDGNTRLVESARAAITDPANELYLSAASAWEIAIKYELGRLRLRVPPHEYVVEQRRLHRINSLPITEESTLQVGKLPGLHRDPFDRILVAQAIVEGLTIVTSDRLVSMYPVRVIW